MMLLWGSSADTELLLPGFIIAAMAMLGVIAEGVATWHRRQAAGISDVKDLLVSVRQLVGDIGDPDQVLFSVGGIREIEEKLIDLIRDVNDRRLSTQLETVLTTFRLVFMCPHLQGCIWEAVDGPREDSERAREAAKLRSQRAQECLIAAEAARERWRSLSRWTR